MFNVVKRNSIVQLELMISSPQIKSNYIIATKERPIWMHFKNMLSQHMIAIITSFSCKHDI